MSAIGSYNPFPHVIASNGIEHTDDCPGCIQACDLYECTMRILDRLEAETQ